MVLRVGGASGAGGSKKNNTGVWRTVTPVVDLEKCTSCRRCESYCPDGCIDIREDGCVIDFFYCKGCGICAYECPVNAIRMEV